MSQMRPSLYSSRISSLTLSTLLASTKKRVTEGNKLISRALDLDEDMAVQGKHVEKAKATLNFYIQGGEILKSILSIDPNNIRK